MSDRQLLHKLRSASKRILHTDSEKVKQKIVSLRRDIYKCKQILSMLETDFRVERFRLRFAFVEFAKSYSFIFFFSIIITLLLFLATPSKSIQTIKLGIETQLAGIGWEVRKLENRENFYEFQNKMLRRVFKEKNTSQNIDKLSGEDIPSDLFRNFFVLGAVDVAVNSSRNGCRHTWSSSKIKLYNSLTSFQQYDKRSFNSIFKDLNVGVDCLVSEVSFTLYSTPESVLVDISLLYAWSYNREVKLRSDIHVLNLEGIMFNTFAAPSRPFQFLWGFLSFILLIYFRLFEKKKLGLSLIRQLVSFAFIPVVMMFWVLFYDVFVVYPQVQRILAKADSDLIHDTTVSTKMERSAMAVVLFCLWIQTIFRLKGLPLIGPVSVTFFRTIFSWEVIRFLCFFITFFVLAITTPLLLRLGKISSSFKTTWDGVQSILSLLFAEKYEKMIRSPNVVAKSDGDEVFHVITLFIFLIFMNLLLAVVASHYQKMKVKSNVAYEDYITNALQTHVKGQLLGR